MSTIPITTGLIFGGPHAVPRVLAMGDVGVQERWLARHPARDELELWFRQAWAAYHDCKLKDAPSFMSKARRTPPDWGYDTLHKSSLVLLVAIKVKVEARE